MSEVKPEDVSDEAIAAATRAFDNADAGNKIRATIAAALNAWPKAFHAPILDWKVNGPRPSTSDGFADMRQFAPHPAIILPLVKP